MKRVVVCLVVALAAALIPPASAGGALKHLAQEPVRIKKGVLADGSDMAFQGNKLYAGTYEGLGIFDLLDGPPYIRQRSFFPCPGPQGDVSVWGDIVLMSREATNDGGIANAPCNRDIGDQTGLRVIDISDPRRPEQVGFVPMPCGSHTHTIVPHGDELIVYISTMEAASVLSNPSNHPCNRDAAAGFGIARVPIDRPEDAKLIGEYDSGNHDGCHDVTVFMPRKFAVAACAWTHSEILDISDPTNPKRLSLIVNPEIMIHHNSSITWDGKYLALGDERALTAGCFGNRVGAIWFYDIRDPLSPVEVGHYDFPRMPGAFETAYADQCWAHQFNIVPMRDPKKYVLVAGYYAGGLTVVDFSDPSSPREIAFDDPRGNDMWGAYFYDGRIYTLDWLSGRGVGVYEHSALGRDDTFSLGPRVNPQLQIDPRSS